MKEYRFLCYIYVHHPNVHRYDFMRKMAEYLNLEEPKKVSYDIRAKEYDLNNHDIQGGVWPSYYSDNDYLPHFFDSFMYYEPKINGTDDFPNEEEFYAYHAKHITHILETLWAHKIPAATFSYVDELLPWEGGNDQSKIFWKDEPKYKKSEGTC